MKVAAIAVAAVGATIIFPPAAALLGSAAVATGLSTGFYATAAIAAAAAGATAGVVTGVGMGVAATVQTVANAIKRTTNTVKLEGRNTKIPSGYKRRETDDSRKLSTDFYDRIIIKDQDKNEISAILCPDYEVN